MKKNVFLVMALMASLSFTSCSKDKITDDNNDGVVNGDFSINLQVDNGGDGLVTRAGRPLLSSQARQDINTVVLYVVDESNKIVLKKTVTPSEWANAQSYNGTYGHGKQLQITFKGSDNQKLPASSSGTPYTIYAVGYKQDSGINMDYSGVNISGAPETVSGPATVAFTNLYATIANGKRNADEIFAGTVKVKAVEKEGNAYLVKDETTLAEVKVETPYLVLNRQVAGVTGYFTNIKAKYGEQIPAKLRLIASNKSDKVLFTSLLGGETPNQPSAGRATNQAIINGTQTKTLNADIPYWNTENKGYTVYEINLEDFYPQMKLEDGSKKTFAELDLDGDGVVGYKDAQYYVYGKKNLTEEELKNWSKDIQGGQTVTGGHSDGKTKKLSDYWTNPLNTAEHPQSIVAGSVFAGEFIIPFLQKAGVNTFELQLLSDKGAVLTTWNVQVPAKEKVGDGKGAMAEGITGSTWTKDESTLVYSVYRNHMYSLGLKANNTDPTDPTDPTEPVDPKPDPTDPTDPDPDQPEDLSKGEALQINVNDNWEVIHQMEID